jgi:hypothetical protein
MPRRVAIIHPFLPGDADAGLAAGLLNTATQLGGGVGLARVRHDLWQVAVRSEAARVGMFRRPADRAWQVFRDGRDGNHSTMHPHTPAAPGTPTEPLPVAQVNVGMTVVDSTGAEAGTVTAVQMPGTDVRPDTDAGVAEHLMSDGYARIDGTGLLSNDVYAGGDQIAGITEGDPGVVELRVPRDQLHRAAG